MYCFPCWIYLPDPICFEVNAVECLELRSSYIIATMLTRFVTMIAHIDFSGCPARMSPKMPKKGWTHSELEIADSIEYSNVSLAWAKFGTPFFFVCMMAPRDRLILALTCLAGDDEMTARSGWSCGAQWTKPSTTALIYGQFRVGKDSSATSWRRQLLPHRYPYESYSRLLPWHWFGQYT